MSASFTTAQYQDIFGHHTRTLDETIQLAIENYLRAHVHTTFPATVLKVHNASVVDIQPVIQRRYKTGALVTLPPIQQVPVVGLAGATWWVKCPVAVGDAGVAFVSERSLDAWLASTQSSPVDPQDSRMFAMSDAQFLPGIRRTSEPLPDGPNASDLIVHNGLAEIHVQAGGTFAFTNGTNELMSLLNTLLSDLIAAQVATSIGPQPFVPNTIQQLQQVQAKLKTLLGT